MLAFFTKKILFSLIFHSSLHDMQSTNAFSLAEKQQRAIVIGYTMGEYTTAAKKILLKKSAG